ncbi:MAG: class C beta-lactamase-related serine hydrolase [Cytophagales bacterium]|nr:MAG: class C beta-lactamase-related serine hydrolase [Cytophagales bacterium]TAF61391.1 MAG: class C beta-lactamase-related serine hydrolase [Cytophagales bacterium]
MTHFKHAFWVFFLVFLFGCKKNTVNPTATSIYFPPKAGSWATANLDSLGWNKAALADLNGFLERGNTRAFLILKDGKIAHEIYFGKELRGDKPFGNTSLWYWASAAKTLTSTLIGIAQQEGMLKIEESSQKYLGKGWSSLSPEQEQKITIKNHLTMTTGLDDSNFDCTKPECLKYLAEPSTRWAYHNAPYTILDQILSSASRMSFDDFFNTRLQAPLGMSGIWSYAGYNHLYISDARSMARFGICILAKGKWQDKQIINEAYLAEMLATSQGINPSYGYLWWLNGKSKFMAPGSQMVFNTSLAPNAPTDAVCALGKNGQIIDVVPSQNLVVVRMGENPDPSNVPLVYHDELWEKINAVVKK